ncbi:MAG: hypothetical protein JW882_05910 [Deltaproteobacteria bacterium]|nr:hypothetical protein [Deltaproteobacteria bacterium]
MKNNRIEWKNIRFVPILHNKMEFALEIRRQFKEFMPEHVAVEYPETLKAKIIKAVKRLPFLSVVHYVEDDGTFIYLLIEPTDGIVEAIRLAIEGDIPLHFIDRDTEGYPVDRTPMPDPFSITKIGHYNYCHAYLDTHVNDTRSSQDQLRGKTMAYSLQQLSMREEKILFVGGLYHFPHILEMLDFPQTTVIGRRHRKGVEVAQLHSDSSREIMSEMPFLAAEYESFRSGDRKNPPDRLKINSVLIKIAEKQLRKNYNEDLSITQIRILNKFARNYAFLTGNLVPDFYQTVVASRSAVDDNFAYEVWDKGCDYPWQNDNPGIPVMRLRGEDLFLDQKKILFHRRLKSSRTRLVPAPIRKKLREKTPGEWRKNFSGRYICSYPPEDVVIEGYGRHLMKRALEIKSEENSRIITFSSSMLDGIDIRETIRKWQENKLYVKENRPLNGKVGSVVVIFDPDLPGQDGKERFPWLVTWLGEHDQESDMAFYSTPAGDIMDGPGISRCQYGGFMLTYPPMRVYDIWKDSYFDTARFKPERLLMAAIDYCLERHVVYVSGAPPSGHCQSVAAGLGKKIIYIPIGVFSPVMLKKLRQFHVLDGHHVRKYAHHYI